MQGRYGGVPIINADLNGIHLLPPSDELKASSAAKVQARSLASLLLWVVLVAVECLADTEQSLTVHGALETGPV